MVMVIVVVMCNLLILEFKENPTSVTTKFTTPMTIQLNNFVMNAVHFQHATIQFLVTPVPFVNRRTQTF